MYIKNVYIMYIYIYMIFIKSVYIYIHIYNTDKNNLFSQLVSAVAVLKGYVEFVIYKCCRIFDVILRLTLVILDHMQKGKIMGLNKKSA